MPEYSHEQNLRLAQKMLDQQGKITALTKERDGAYRERAHLLAWLATIHAPHAVLAPAIDIDDEDGWHLLFLTVAGRQMSWHIAPRDAELFDHVEHVEWSDPRAAWDGHTTDEKYKRIRTMPWGEMRGAVREALGEEPQDISRMIIDRPFRSHQPKNAEPVVDRQTAEVLSALHRSAEDTVTRVIELAERRNLDGPPPENRPLTELRAALDEPSSPAATQATEPDTCRSVEVDGETILVRGSGEFTEQEQQFAEEIVRAAKRKYATEHPEPAPAGLRDQIAAAVRKALMDDPMETLPGLQERIVTAVLAVILPATRITAILARVIELAERWNLDGPPPGNRPLTELRAALDEPKEP